MQEEFHGIWNGTVVTAYKLLYGWGTLNANVWLPSLCELVGYDPTMYWADGGCYFSAMQELNTSNAYCVDTKGGAQFAYFQQFNASSGGEAIMNACNQQRSWTRSCTMDTARYTWRTTSTERFDWGLVTDSYAVHPAV